MNNKMKWIISCLFLLLSLPAWAGEDPAEIIQSSFDYYRGQTSEAEVDMLIHRPDWERKISIHAWTLGRDTSLFRIRAPAKDKGTGTLKKGREMWTYTPKINRVIKLPPSMMMQSWMGSDFSNNDLSKSDSILYDYEYEFMEFEEHEGHQVYVIKAIPKPDAPVVWGMQIQKIRDDYILLEQHYFDEDKVLVKMLITQDIISMNGKLFPRIWTMKKADSPNEYTQLTYNNIEFDIEISKNKFTLSTLKK